jgi:hypothetical protein
MIYAVTLTRICKDIESAIVQVEADTPEEAEEAALKVAFDDSTQWGKPEPLDTEGPEVHSVEEIAEGDEPIPDIP